MTLILILSGSFLVFIVSLILAQMCFFGRRWGWFCAATLLALVSGGCIFAEGYPCLCPKPSAQEQRIQTLQPL